MKTARLITCNQLPEAHLIRARLQSEGIDCFLTNENFTNMMPMFNQMLGAGVQVIVKEEDLEKSRGIIDDKLNPGKITRCPNCGSTEVGIGVGKNKLMKLFSILMAFLNAIPLGNVEPGYHCKNCGKDIN